MNSSRKSIIMTNTIVKMSVLVALAVFTITYITLSLQQNELETKAEALANQILEADEKIYALQSELDRPFNEEYIAEIAHAKLGLRYPQEIIYYSGGE